MPKIIAAEGTIKICQCSSGSKAQITVLGCANTITCYLKGNYLGHSMYEMSLNGWMDQELFAMLYVCCHVILYVCMYVHMYVVLIALYCNVCMYVCTYVCMFVHI